MSPRSGYKYLEPEALARFYLHPDPPPTGVGHVGASWMTREDRLSEIGDNVAYLDALARHIFRRVERERVLLRVVGFSQGAFAAARWTVRDWRTWSGCGAPTCTGMCRWPTGVFHCW